MLLQAKTRPVSLEVASPAFGREQPTRAVINYTVHAHKGGQPCVLTLCARARQAWSR